MGRVKETIEALLRDTKREGIDELIEHMNKIGFFEAPASTKYHGAYEGALAEHSLNVAQCAYDIASALDYDYAEEYYNSINICALLHDLGKAGQFGKPLYIDNVLKSGKTSEAQPYKHNDELMTLDHEIVSVIEASRFIKLTEEEQFAIAFHNGLYTSIGRYGLQGKETPLQMIIHFADMWASRVIER